MNFLAHIALSGENSDIMIGNFIGDFVKGNPEGEYPENIIRGIQLHRKIDFFTDQHDVVKRCKLRLSSKYRHYSGVIVDMYFDHFLSKNWEFYYKSDLHEFVDSAYSLLLSNEAILPEKVNSMLGYMVKQNWLVNYGSFEGLDKALGGLARRTSFKSGMEYAVKDLKAEYEIFKSDFDEFYPILQDYSKSQLE